jgi:hypothetical protein
MSTLCSKALGTKARTYKMDWASLCTRQCRRVLQHVDSSILWCYVVRRIPVPPIYSLQPYISTVLFSFVGFCIDGIECCHVHGLSNLLSDTPPEQLSFLWQSLPASVLEMHTPLSCASNELNVYAGLQVCACVLWYPGPSREGCHRPCWPQLSRHSQCPGAYERPQQCWWQQRREQFWCCAWAACGLLE